MGTIELWDYAVCAPDKDRCQVRRNGSERCTRNRAKFLRHHTELVIGACTQHQKMLLGRGGWRDWPVPDSMVPTV